MNVYEKMLETIESHSLFRGDAALILMVSGGSDSTALARLAARLRDEGKIGVVDMFHMNHMLRGQDSDEDAEFVKGLSEELCMPLFSCQMDIASEAARTGGNIEAIARKERYSSANEALFSMCQHEGVPISDARIVTAHTSDDRIENFYMRSIVGTGPGGFRSMLYRNGSVVRPLLDCSREQLRSFLAEEAALDVCEAGRLSDNSGLWREDATNAHTDRFRAYVRHNIVPKAREWNPQLDETLSRTMNLIGEEDDMLDDMAQDVIDADVEPLGDEAADGFLLAPDFADVRTPLARRAVIKLLKPILGFDERIDAKTVEAVLRGFKSGSPDSGYVTNIQGNLAVSANKLGVRVEPMAAFRARRKRL